MALAIEGEGIIADVAKYLGLVEQTLGNWVRQARIDRGEKAGLTSDERAEHLRTKVVADALDMAIGARGGAVAGTIFHGNYAAARNMSQADRAHVVEAGTRHSAASVPTSGQTNTIRTSQKRPSGRKTMCPANGGTLDIEFLDVEVPGLLRVRNVLDSYVAEEAPFAVPKELR